MGPQCENETGLQVAANAPAGGRAAFVKVVPPFANLSGDPGQDYLVDALTDESDDQSRALSAPPSSSRATRP